MVKEQYIIDVFCECIGQYKDKDIVVVLFIVLKYWKILMIYFWWFLINVIIFFLNYDFLREI